MLKITKTKILQQLIVYLPIVYYYYLIIRYNLYYFYGIGCETPKIVDCNPLSTVITLFIRLCFYYLIVHLLRRYIFCKSSITAFKGAIFYIYIRLFFVISKRILGIEFNVDFEHALDGFFVYLLDIIGVWIFILYIRDNVNISWKKYS